jgi:hypothetical protein
VAPTDEQAEKKESGEGEEGTPADDEAVKPHPPANDVVQQNVGAFCFSKLTISDMYITYAAACVHTHTHTLSLSLRPFPRH